MRARLLRPAVPTGLLGLVLTAGLAGAAPAQHCNVVTDATGDGTGFILTDRNYLPNSPNLDLVTGDIATKAKTITAVIRTAELALSASDAPTGRIYTATFLVGETKLYLTAALDGAGAGTFSAGSVTGTSRTKLGDATGVVDVEKKEVRISAPTTLFAEKAVIKNGVKILDLNLMSQRFLGAAGTGIAPATDVATGGKTYTAGAASCVPVGR